MLLDTQDDTVWTIKLYIIGTLNLNADTDDPLNFGVYLPHAGKYLDEQSARRAGVTGDYTSEGTQARRQE